MSPRNARLASITILPPRVIAVIAAAVVSVGGVVAISTGGPSPQQVAGGGGGGGVTCTGSPLNSGADVATALAAASAGDTICLNAGTYTYSAGAITKASETTVTAAPGVSRDAVTIRNAGTTTGPGNSDNMKLGASHNLTFRGISIAGMSISTSGTNATNLLFQHIHWTGCAYLNQGATGTMNVTLDGDTADVSAYGSTNQPCDHDGRIELRTIDGGNAGYGGTADVGLVVKNMDLQQSNCTDAIELDLGVSGATIGPGNEFHNLTNSGICASILAHVDPVQLFLGGYYTTIIGNYFHNNTIAQDFQAPNSTHHTTITQNVFNESSATSAPFQSYLCGWCEATDFTHNTVIAHSPYTGEPPDNEVKSYDWTGAGEHDPQHSSGVINNNVVTNDSKITINDVDTGNLVTEDYNLVGQGAAGAHDVTGSPTFVGGSTPTTYAGFALSCPTSPGCAAASDGTNMGINP